MKNQQIELTVSPRQTGKHNSRQARRQEQVPGILYGPKTKNRSILADELAIRKYTGHKYESTIFKLKSDDASLNGQSVILKSIQVHPVQRRPLHVDFYAVDMTSVLRVHVPIHLEGKPAGLAEGGMLQAVLRELEIECLPSDIPDHVVADVSALGVGDSLHVSDLKMASNIRIITSGQQTIATVSVMAEEKIEPAAAAAPAAGTAAAGAAAPAAGAAAAGAAAGGDKAKK